MPAARAKSMDDKRVSNSTNPLETQGSFIESLFEVMAQATQDDHANPSSTKKQDTVIKQEVSMELPNLNTDEILDIANNMNTDNIQNISMKLSDSLKLSDETPDHV